MEPKDTKIDATVGAQRRALIDNLGLIAFKYLVTLNGGAFIVLLTFIGNAAENERFVISLTALKLAMSFFLLALFLTFIGIAVAFISAQLSLSNRKLPGAGSERGHIVWLTAPVILAFFAFVAGVVAAMLGIT